MGAMNPLIVEQLLRVIEQDRQRDALTWARKKEASMLIPGWRTRVGASIISAGIRIAGSCRVEVARELQRS